ncbi:hypothetical protein K2173_004382 [Erythroxylum novogranatense]|uniref:PB1 domain-containing protein n=1 Tax=Erythroxylum novogranatense TaxID=1862640 RepID=A0AAV8T4B1_9ROSI|nr:hypothetical protein K2173_004382 [Erythroxylum novogranatense]
MASFHPSELDCSGANDSVASSPRSDHYVSTHDLRVRFMCSFGGNILPRPHDNQLRYVGGDTRIVAIHRSTTFSTLLTQLSKLSGIANLSVKYQLPNEDLDALISVTTDEDVDNMMEEYDRVFHNQNPRSARLRLFLFPKGEESRPGSISSLLDGSTNREHWFLDALNTSSQLERGRSEASSIVSEVPEYLFGLENSDETQPPPPPPPREPRAKSRLVLQDNLSASDPGSPAPVVASPYCSTSTTAPMVPSIPYLPPVKTKPENPDLNFQPKQSSVGVVSQPQMTQSAGYPGANVMHYVSDSHYPGPPMQQIPVYYVPGPVPHGNAPVQAVQVQSYQIPTGQVPVGYHQQVPGMGQVYGAMPVRPLTSLDPYEAARLVPSEGVNQAVYYGVRNASTGMVGGHPGMVTPTGEDLPRTSSNAKQLGRI